MARLYAGRLNLKPLGEIQGNPIDFAAKLAADTLEIDEGWAKDLFEQQVESAGGLQELGINGERILLLVFGSARQIVQASYLRRFAL